MGNRRSRQAAAEEHAAKAFPADLRLLPVSRRPTLLPEETVEELLARPLPEPAPSDDAPEATVVVTTSDGLPHTRLCLESVLAGAAGLSLEVVVVDNGSSDGTREYLEALADRDARVRTLLNDTNLGFAPAVNQGLATARGKALVVLNNDTAVPPGALRLLVRHLEDARVGLLGPVSNEAATEAEVDGKLRDVGRPRTGGAEARARPCG